MTDHPERVIRYFEDYVPGLVVDCGAFSLDEGEIIAFAKEYDPQPFHVDPVAAKDGPFGGLIASGWHTTSKMMRQLVEYFVSPESGLGAAGSTRFAGRGRYAPATRCTSAPPSSRRGARRASLTAGSSGHWPS